MLSTASKSINQRLKEFRKKANLSQRIVANRLGINQPSYSAIERGKNAIVHTYLPKLAEIFNVEVWQFFAEAKEIGLLEGEDKDFFEVWKQLNTRAKSLVFQISKEFLKCINLEAMRQRVLMESETVSNIDEENKVLSVEN